MLSYSDVYPRMTPTIRVVDKRVSASQSDRGIVRVEHGMHNQNRELVLQQIAVLMMLVSALSEQEEAEHA